MARPVDPKSRAQRAKRLSKAMGFEITGRMVEIWEGKGYDVDDPKSLEKKLRNQSKLPAGMPKKRAAVKKVAAKKVAKKAPAKKAARAVQKKKPKR